MVIPIDPRWPLRSNIALLTHADSRRDLLPSAEVISKIEAFIGDGAVTLGSLCQSVGLSPSLIPVLLVAGVLQGDVAHQQLNSAMTLSLAHGDLTHLEVVDEVGR